jgi:hypothetical protein
MNENEEKKLEPLDWSKGTEYKVEFHAPSVPATLPAHSGSVLRVVPEGPVDPADPADVKKAVELLTDEDLDKKINQLLANPEIDAMLENVAEDAANDIGEAVEEIIAANVAAGETTLPAGPTRAEFDAFTARVEKAFKHAGFKF